jgi:hypothetical protein
MKSFTSFIFGFFLLAAAHAQFAPQAGVSGSTAIKADSSIFVAWATGCQVQRGYRDIALPDSGYATSGSDVDGTGPVDHNLVSLGDSGVATLTFVLPIYNGPGPDFAVFENGFANPANPEEAFLEFAFVEVSSNGTDFYRFPAACYIPDTQQIPVAGVYSDARMVNNLAGKYVSGYGTPFDLDIFAAAAGLDVNHITHVRLVDVVGSVGAHGSLDTSGRKINDPYPTNIPTSGFDLDAVGVIHQATASSVATLNNKPALIVYPNPLTENKLNITVTGDGAVTYLLSDFMGRSLSEGRFSHALCLPVDHLAQGIYYLTLHDNEGNQWVEKVTKL